MANVSSHILETTKNTLTEANSDFITICGNYYKELESALATCNDGVCNVEIHILKEELLLLKKEAILPVEKIIGNLDKAIKAIKRKPGSGGGGREEREKELEM